MRSWLFIELEMGGEEIGGERVVWLNGEMAKWLNG